MGMQGLLKGVGGAVVLEGRGEGEGGGVHGMEGGG